VYLTDTSNTIVYSNRALQQTLSQYQDEVRRDLPDFDAQPR
jgi:methyl-accepting chemotaxis protein